MTDLVERIETTRFLGSEFLVWLWFKAELFQGEFKRPDGSILELWLDSQLLLRDADGQARVQFVGVEPSSTPEAKLVLRSNKLPSRARIGMRLGHQEFSFVLDAQTCSFGSVKLPVVLDETEAALAKPKDENGSVASANRSSQTRKDPHEQLLERMDLLQILDELYKELYAEFLQLRLSDVWGSEFMPAVLNWTHGKSNLTPRAYSGLLGRAGREARRK